ncbi:MAG: protein disulfide oxidoreductase [Gammaproteobacteria bacterium]|nr:protein disulfide oxidoreductase [Gammaproteobacteria bacterium]MBU1447306.1 protein disulfide oxidoreductase [Gammaproteobacteria bacterium]
MNEETQDKQADSRRKRWRSLPINLLLLVIVVGGIRLWQQRDMVSGSAPEVRGVTLAGETFRLPQHLDRPLLVHFWATWCPVCRTEEGNIASIANAGGNVITIAMQSGTADAVRSYQNERQVAFPVLNDPDNSISNIWGVHAVPASFVIDRNGNIRFVEVGYTTELGLRLRLWLAEYI